MEKEKKSGERGVRIVVRRTKVDYDSYPELHLDVFLESPDGSRSFQTSYNVRHPFELSELKKIKEQRIAEISELSAASGFRILDVRE